MNDRERLEGRLEELSPKYDGYVDDAIEYANDRLSAEDAEDFRERMKTDAMFRRVVQPVLDAYEAPPLSRDEALEAWDEFRGRVAAKGLPVPSADPFHGGVTALDEYAKRVANRNRRNWRLIAKAAAVFAFLFAVPASYWVYLEVVHIERVATKPNVFSVVRLPDQSVVELAPGSSMRYAKNFADRKHRWIDFSGEAKFTVAPSPDADFVIETAVADVTVLGTVFTLNARDKMLVVEVHEGKVSVQPESETGEPQGRAAMVVAGSRVRVTSTGVFEDKIPVSIPGAKP
jgi:hypothetical protein